MLKKLGKYELIEEVGRGAMGSVYKAHDPSIDRYVALKTIRSFQADNSDLLERFYREAQSAGGLQHPNIVTIYELGREGETPFIAMEFLEGESLERLIKRRADLSLAQKVGSIVSVTRALEFAHSRGVIHRDIKPANVMLTADGTVKVVDFGIARLADVSKTRTDALIGTLAYMSPQQIHGHRADARSDIWALGVTLYELMCLRCPFEGENAHALMLSIITENPTPLRDLLPECPPALEAIVNKMLRKELNDQFRTMEEVRFELEPLWKNLRESGINGVIADAEAAIQSQDFPRARDVLRKALQFDTGHNRLKPLLEQVNAEIRRVQNHAQIEKSLQTARGLLSQGRYADAKAELEAALDLDPSFAPAQELLAKAKQGAETARLIQDNLQTAKQRFAEDSLTEAGKRIESLLELDPENPDGRALQKQIRERRAWREEQRRRGELLSRARNLWGQGLLEDCIGLLADAHQEFPGDPEIAKTLDKVKEDLQEQKKQEKLTEARRLAAAERFGDAMELLESLSRRGPVDPSVQKLQVYVRQEMERRLRDEKLASEKAKIQVLISEENFPQAVSNGEELLRDFPGQAEIAALVKFAREQLERRRELQEALRSVQKRMDSGKFHEAIGIAEKALIRLPGNADLETKLVEARHKQKEKEDNELLHKRIGEIQRSIKSGHHTEAVDLARQTLTTLGPRPEVAQLLRAAEIELEEKRRRREEQEKRLAETQSRLKEDRVGEARELLQDALETNLLTRKDPKVRLLLEEIEKASSVAAISSSFVLELPGEPGGHSEPGSSFGDSATAIGQITPIPEQSGAVHRVPAELSSAVIVDSQIQPGAFPRVKVHKAPSAFERLRADAISSLSALNSRAKEAPALERFAQTLNISPLATIGGGLAFLALAGTALSVVLIFHSQNQREIAERDRAQQLEKARDWPHALVQYEDLAQRKGRLAAFGTGEATRLRGLLNQENVLMDSAKNEEAKGNIFQARDFYTAAANLGGDKSQEARDAAERLSLPQSRGDAQVQKKSFPETKKASSPALTKSPESAAAATEIHEDKASKCELLPSDIPIYTGMADENRANGKYSDAEREYNAILQCEPQNGQARDGLRRTKVAETLPNRTGN